MEISIVFNIYTPIIHEHFIQFTFDLLDQYSFMGTFQPVLFNQIQEISIQVFTESSNHSMVYFDVTSLQKHATVEENINLKETPKLSMRL